MLKPNHLQSLIATTRTRINEMHEKVEIIDITLPLLKAVNKHTGGAVQEKINEGYKIRDSIRTDIKKAVELQKALKKELQDSYESNKVVKNKVYVIDVDGQPKQDGLYYVMYEWHSNDYRSEKLLFKKGKWFMEDGGVTAFGNYRTYGERYVAV